MGARPVHAGGGRRPARCAGCVARSGGHGADGERTGGPARDHHRGGAVRRARGPDPLGPAATRRRFVAPAQLLVRAPRRGRPLGPGPRPGLGARDRPVPGGRHRPRAGRAGFRGDPDALLPGRAARAARRRGPAVTAASRLVVGLQGGTLAAHEREWLARWRPAGLILFARNCDGPEACGRLIAEIAGVLGAGAEICADHEGGAVSALEAAVGPSPSPRTLGDLDDPDLTRSVCEQTGRRLHAIGLRRVLAPCCDVLTESRNPVIGARSFGADPAKVARHAEAAVLGYRAAGLVVCAKHWPGHGGTAVDTHTVASAPVAAEVAPFEAAIAAGADALMVGHLRARADGPPLALDAAALDEVRARFGATVGLWSDDVSMGALRAPMRAAGIVPGDGRDEGLVDPGRLPAAWLDAIAGAGCERLLLCGIPWRALPLDAEVPAPPDPLTSQPAADTPPAPTAAAREAWQRAAASIDLQLADPRLLWLDTTASDRLPAAAVNEAVLRARWPQLAHLDAAAPRLVPQPPFAQLLVTSHRPLTVAQATVLEPLLAAVGEALVAGHPCLGDDLARLAGPGWRIVRLAGCTSGDLAPWLAPDAV
ncbi:hypothetical protein GF314_17285 [bacterium]|nr:hypothetical protein [bacterium]